jgi:DNA-binding MarR family transcriptional regulator
MPAIVKEVQLAQPTGPVPTIISVFRRAAGVMNEDLVARLAAAGFAGLNPSHQAVFENLDPGGTRLTELAARAGMTHQSMSELVSVLGQRGYLERRVDPGDRRARMVCLTSTGRRMARRALQEMAAIEADWRERLASTGVTGDIVGAISGALASRAARSHGDVIGEGSGRHPRSRRRTPHPAQR